MKKKPNILCVCAQGLNRSKYLARYLKSKGYETKYRGANIFSLNKLHKEDIKWADVIILIVKKYEKKIKKNFKLYIRGKKFIVINVPYHFMFKYRRKYDLNLRDYFNYNEKYTYPHLRKAIKEYLPL